MRAATILLALAALPGPSWWARAAEDPGAKDIRIIVAPNETEKGDRNVVTGSGVVAGTLEGDLRFFGSELDIPGIVTGDVLAVCSKVVVAGTVKGSLHTFASQVTVAGNVGDELRFTGATLHVLPSASIGDLSATGSSIRVEGDVRDGVEATGGEIRVSAKIAHDAELHADQVVIDPATRIGGDLYLSSRNEVPEAGPPVVAGTVHRNEASEQWQTRHDHEEAHWARSLAVHKTIGLLQWIGMLLIFLLLGWLTLRLLPDLSAEVVGNLAREPLLCAGIGFMASIVIPVVSTIAILLIVGLFAWIGFIVLFYLAKLPVAIWIGRGMAQALGRPVPSPARAMVFGAIPMYLLFAIPIVGWIAWFVAGFLGLGAILIVANGRLRARRARVAAATSAPAPGPI